MFTHEMIKSFNQLEMDVYNYIISNEEKVVYMKVRELAEAVHVSTTTILRFCKKVGCEGYSEFRLKLKQEVSSKEKKKINIHRIWSVVSVRACCDTDCSSWN